LVQSKTAGQKLSIDSNHLNEEQFRMPGTLMTKVWHYYSYSQTKKV